MGVRHVVRNIGNGSLFGHNRFFGVHNPLDYDIQKARDPFINLRTLVKLSRCPDPCVKQQVARNLAARLDRLDPKFLFRFDREIIIDALALTNKLFYRTENWGPIAKIVNEATPEELGKLAQSPSFGILSLVLENPKTSKSTKLEIIKLAIDKRTHAALVDTAYKELREGLISSDLGLIVDSLMESKFITASPSSHELLTDLVQHPETSRETKLKLCLSRPVKYNMSLYSQVSLGAYNSIVDTITSEELRQLAESSNIEVLEKVGDHPKTAPSNVARIVARIVSGITSKTKKVVDREPTYKTGTYEDYAAGGGDPAHGPCSLPEVIDDPGESHYEYGESDLRYAEQILSKHGSNRDEILSELKEINPGLASAIKSI